MNIICNILKFKKEKIIPIIMRFKNGHNLKNNYIYALKIYKITILAVGVNFYFEI